MPIFSETKTTWGLDTHREPSWQSRKTLWVPPNHEKHISASGQIWVSKVGIPFSPGILQELEHALGNSCSPADPQRHQR